MCLIYSGGPHGAGCRNFSVFCAECSGKFPGRKENHLGGCPEFSVRGPGVCGFLLQIYAIIVEQEGERTEIHHFGLIRNGELFSRIVGKGYLADGSLRSF